MANLQKVAINDEDNAEEEEEQEPVQDFKYYLQPHVTHKIVATEWAFFTFLSGIVYLVHLFWTVYGIDAFASWERHNTCTGATTIQAAEDKYKIPIALCVFFHMIEWFRQTIFATTAMVNVNLIKVYYVLSFNACYGFIAMIIAIIYGWSADESCAAAQKKRTWYLKLQLVAFLLYIPMSWLHVIYFYARGTEWCHEIWTSEEDDDD